MAHLEGWGSIVGGQEISEDAPTELKTVQQQRTEAVVQIDAGARAVEVDVALHGGLGRDGLEQKRRLLLEDAKLRHVVADHSGAARLVAVPAVRPDRPRQPLGAVRVEVVARVAPQREHRVAVPSHRVVQQLHAAVVAAGLGC